MYILGINYYIHNSSAFLMRDSHIICAFEEERLNRQKHSNVFPELSIQQCLKFAALRIEDIDFVCISWNPSLKYIGKKAIDCYKYSKGFSHFGRLITSEICTNRDFAQTTYQKLRKIGFPDKTRIKFIDHHRAHAASSFYLSPYEDAAIMTIDGRGEWTTTFLGYGVKNRIYKIREMYFPHSLGIFYSAVTQYLGFKENDEEYKVMGLSSYGKNRYADIFEDIIKEEDGGGFALSLKYFSFLERNWSYAPGPKRWFSDYLVEKLGPPCKNPETLDQKYADIALSLQKRLEEIVMHMAKWLYSKTRIENLCIAGGVGLNCVMNQRLLQNSPFKKIFIQPASGDAGTAIGAPLYYFHNELGNNSRKSMEHVYLGSEFSTDYIERALELYKLKYRESGDVCEETARLIANGNVVGWFQGRMEFGPRALGNRSILADPRNHNMKNIVNGVIKFRENFRPFAPSVLVESAQEYFALKEEAPYMLVTADVIKEKEDRIPAVVHADSTARIQTVSRETNPKYWMLIKKFEEVTGVPVILNTSFNVKGEPIVCTPDDAIRCFFTTGLDYLVLGNYIVEK